ncbi:MAG TPA: hypothetical protein VNS32_15315 [Flavisolibacter sp.]|nr:hypothetical protein [Flavisolibacter sp.]
MLIRLFVITSLFITGCINRTNEPGVDMARANGSDDMHSSYEELVKQSPIIMGSWENIQFGDLKILAPSGKDWKKGSDRIFINNVNGCTIIFQSQAGDYRKNMDEYLSSYNEVNKRDAPKYELLSQKIGKVKGILAARVHGRFDNGEEMATRDYVLFTNYGVSILQGRSKEKDEEYLNDMIDYIVAHIHY